VKKNLETCLQRKFEDTKQISDYLNGNFCTIGVNLQHTLKQCNADDFKAYLSNSVKDSMYCAPITKDEILKILQNLKTISLLVLIA